MKPHWIPSLDSYFKLNFKSGENEKPGTHRGEKALIRNTASSIQCLTRTARIQTVNAANLIILQTSLQKAIQVGNGLRRLISEGDSMCAICWVSKTASTASAWQLTNIVEEAFGSANKSIVSFHHILGCANEEADILEKQEVKCP